MPSYCTATIRRRPSVDARSSPHCPNMKQNCVCWPQIECSSRRDCARECSLRPAGWRPQERCRCCPRLAFARWPASALCTTLHGERLSEVGCSESVRVSRSNRGGAGLSFSGPAVPQSAAVLSDCRFRPSSWGTKGRVGQCSTRSTLRSSMKRHRRCIGGTRRHRNWAQPKSRIWQLLSSWFVHLRPRLSAGMYVRCLFGDQSRYFSEIRPFVGKPDNRPRRCGRRLSSMLRCFQLIHR